ncbi:Uncharacterised protein [Acinetobacter baumannii]|nr:Uncharacterised protein [Acinetobacter baumannii]
MVYSLLNTRQPDGSGDEISASQDRAAYTPEQWFQDKTWCGLGSLQYIAYYKVVRMCHGHQAVPSVVPDITYQSFRQYQYIAYRHNDRNHQ